VKHTLATGIPGTLALGTLGLNAAAEPAARPLQVVCVGAHPDDPESGCSGTLIRYAAQGHAVTVVYLTRGERGIPGKTNDEAAQIRSQEAAAACRIIGAQAVFAGQIDGAAEFTRPNVEKLGKILAEIQPDLVFAHWPIDTHMDHQAASLCAHRACQALTPKPRLYFFEVNTGSQSQGFTPNTYVDITAVVDKKKLALLAHVSQDGEGIWKQHHEVIADFRGREAGVKAAEAFVRLNREVQAAGLPGVR